MKNENYPEKKTNPITFILSTSSKVGTINAKKIMLLYYNKTRVCIHFFAYVQSLQFEELVTSSEIAKNLIETFFSHKKTSRWPKTIQG